MNNYREIRHFHLFCGLGGGAAGFNRGQARVGSMQARFRCLGGVDSDKRAIADFSRLAGVPGTLLNLFDRDQFRAFHGEEPSADWREATPADIRKAAGNERPHIVFTSPPCKAFSGLLSEGKSKTEKYQALNRLTVRGIWLTLEAWKDDLPEFVILENVPRIQNRGRHLLDQIGGLLRRYGYAVAETTHDCGELGGLAESRKRFLLVARHMEKVPPFLYEPEKRPLLAVGDILGRMPMPGDPSGGAMHRVPSLQWKTWVRLAFVEAGGDWRSLNKLAVQDGTLKDYLILPERRAHYLGVNAWNAPTGTISGRGTVTNGRYAVADPRLEEIHDGTLGVLPWEQASGAVTASGRPMTGRFSVADPRPGYKSTTHQNIYRIVPWDSASKTVVGASHVAGGALAVADPRTGLARAKGDHYLTAAHYGVVPWAESCGAVSAAAGHDNGKWSVADPRASCFSIGNEADEMPDQNTNLVAVIRALDNTWHRPFTTLELAALQGLVDPEEHLELEGLSDSAWRERIGNAVPPPAAQAIAGVMGQTLLLAWSGETFMLNAMPIWVQPVAVALSVVGGVA
ncbi:DNA cytosine methyltransferase [Acidithiobacillus ferrivorans]|uniref:DNA cytosine methyltransferase n=1 Tax=Acidithiobacillus ferrivorans TaxID=160808 RepID=A0A7T5BHU1_9PROT|nr:DNA cytosine methyltransferase [Acidithiobacillus ferrivorans]QQD72983.1 DNA cytosine methyltransferase [Acidithiobacillus ferrivorans]